MWGLKRKTTQYVGTKNVFLLIFDGNLMCYFRKVHRSNIQSGKPTANNLIPLPITQEIIESSGGPCHLSTIPLKNFHLFKITDSVINFYLKKFSN